MTFSPAIPQDTEPLNAAYFDVFQKCGAEAAQLSPAQKAKQRRAIDSMSICVNVLWERRCSLSGSEVMGAFVRLDRDAT
jgi:hypothetical protein